MSTEHASKDTKPTTHQSVPETAPAEDWIALPGAQPILQLQRLIGNKRTQQVISAAPAAPTLRRSARLPFTPTARAAIQRDDDEAEAQSEDVASVVDTRSSAAAAYAAVPESAVALTPTQIRNAINYNRHRFAPQSVAAIRRYFDVAEGTQVDEDLIRHIARYQIHFGLGEDGLIGERTYDHIDLHQLLESTVTGTPSTDADLIFSINVNKEPLRYDYVFVSGTNPPMRFRAVHRFSVEVMFPRHAHPEQFRYRQMIKGEAWADHNGAFQEFETFFSKIPVTGRLPMSYTEDGNSDWTDTGVFYGRRSDRGQPTATSEKGQNQYFDNDGPNQRRGHIYRGTDGPKLIVSGLQPGTNITLNMQFIGQVVRVATGEVMQEKRWTAFDFTDIVPSTEEASG